MTGSKGAIPGCARPRSQSDTMKTSPRLRARHLLEDLLASGTRRAVDIQAFAAEAGISRRTLARAKRDIHVRTMRADGAWWWSLSTAPAAPPAPPCSSSTTTSGPSRGPTLEKPTPPEHAPAKPPTPNLPPEASPAVEPLAIEQREGQRAAALGECAVVQQPAPPADHCAEVPDPSQARSEASARVGRRPAAASALRRHFEAFLADHPAFDPAAESTKLAWGEAYRAEQSSPAARAQIAPQGVPGKLALQCPAPAHGAATASPAFTVEALANVAAWGVWRDLQLAQDSQADVSLSAFVSRHEAQSPHRPPETPTAEPPTQARATVAAPSERPPADGHARPSPPAEFDLAEIEELEAMLARRADSPAPPATGRTTPPPAPLSAEAPAKIPPALTDHEANLAELSRFSGAEVRAALASVLGEPPGFPAGLAARLIDAPRCLPDHRGEVAPVAAPAGQVRRDGASPRPKLTSSAEMDLLHNGEIGSEDEIESEGEGEIKSDNLWEPSIFARPAATAATSPARRAPPASSWASALGRGWPGHRAV